MMHYDPSLLERAIELSQVGMEKGDGGPFGCVVARNGKIIAEGNNQVTLTNDPTAHAEVVAIRNACKALNSFQLDGCDIYTSCEPCPMCLGAIYWARAARVIFANTKNDAATIAFDDAFIYKELGKQMEDRYIPFIHAPHPKALEIFRKWDASDNKTVY